MDNQEKNTSEKPLEQSFAKNPEQPPQKISLTWVFLGIGAILLMWFVSYKVF